MSTAQRRTSRIASNIAWNFASGIASIFGLLLLYPLSVRSAGPEAYGIWVLAFGAIQLFAQADFGLGTGIVRTLNTIRPDDIRHDERRHFVTVGQTAFLVLALVLTLVYVVLFPLYLSTVTMPDDLAGAVPFVVAVSAGSLFFSVMGRCSNAILWAEDRPDIERKSSLGGLAFRAAGLAFVLWLGWGLLGVVVVEAVSIAIPSLICGIAVAVRYGWPKFSHQAYKTHLTPLLRISGVLFLGTFASVAASQIPLWVIGATLGLTATTAFGALLRIFQSGKLAVSWLTNPFTHAIVSATDGSVSARAAAAKCFGLTISVAVICAIPLALLPAQILEIWLGEDFVFAGSSLALIAVAVMANAVILPSALITTLRSNPWPTSITSLFLLLLTAIGVAFGAGTGSLYWATLGMVVPLAVVAPVYFLLAHRVIDLRIDRSGVRSGTALIVFSLVLSIVAGLFSYFLNATVAVVCYTIVAAAFAAARLARLRKI